MSKERPILMSGAMVRAVLDGSKTQTRRIVKQLDPREGAVTTGGNGQPMAACWAYGGPVIPCPYGVPGEHLWVRATWYRHDDRVQSGPYFEVDGAREILAYRADGERPYEAEQPVWRPSIHMPRWASRILLEIASVRVERLNDCSEADAKAEGVMQLDADNNPRPEARTKDGWQLCPTCAGTGLRTTLGAGGGVNFDVDCSDCDTHLKLYRHLWEAINGAGSWAANPWVWVIEFKQVTP